MTTGTDLTILVALAAGVISFLSPCVLPLVPAYLGQLSAIAVAGGGAIETERPDRWLAMRHAVAFVAGFTAVFTLLGVTATYLAQGLVDILPTLRVVGGAILIVLGLSLAGILRIPVLDRTWRPLDAGAAGSLATTTGSIALSTGSPGARPGLGDRLGGRLVGSNGGWLASLGLGRDLRDRLDAMHRDHPRRDPDDGRDLRHGGARHAAAHRLLPWARAAVHRDRARVRPGARPPTTRCCGTAGRPR